MAKWIDKIFVRWLNPHYQYHQYIANLFFRTQKHPQEQTKHYFSGNFFVVFVFENLFVVAFLVLNMFWCLFSLFTFFSSRKNWSLSIFFSRLNKAAFFYNRFDNVYFARVNESNFYIFRFVVVVDLSRKILCEENWFFSSGINNENKKNHWKTIKFRFFFEKIKRWFFGIILVWFFLSPWFS